MLDIIAFWVRLGLFFVGGAENEHRGSVKSRIHVIYIMQRTSGVKYLVIYGKKLRKLPRVFYLPNSAYDQLNLPFGKMRLIRGCVSPPFGPLAERLGGYCMRTLNCASVILEIFFFINNQLQFISQIYFSVRILLHNETYWIYNLIRAVF